MTTPTNTREGMTLDVVSVSGSPGTEIERSCGITIVTAVTATENIGGLLLLPSNADVGDLVEVYNIYTGSNPSQNDIVLHPPSGETLNFSPDGIDVFPKTMRRARKVDSTSWLLG